MTPREARAAVAVARADFRALLVRSDLCAARARASPPGSASSTRRWPSPAIISRSISSPSRRAPPSRTAYARGDFALPDDETRRRALRGDAGAARPRGPRRPTRFRTTRGRAASAGTISSIGAMAIMSASAPARMAALTLAGEKYATRQRRAPETWLAAVEAQGHAHRGARPGRRRRAARGDADDGPAPRRRRFARPLRRARPAASSRTRSIPNALARARRRRVPGARRRRAFAPPPPAASASTRCSRG